MAAFILAATFMTSVLSGIFGMAGGLILMGLFAWMLPATVALALHGVIQFASNGWRVALHYRHVVWRVLGYFGVGAAGAMSIFSLVAFAPTKFYIFLALGLMPILAWVPERIIKLDIAKPMHGLAAGLISTGLSLVSGVSGPVTDLFFVHTSLTRHQVVASKAVMQAVGHASKIVAYGVVLAMPETRETISVLLLMATIAVSMMGIMVGGAILDRMTEVHFRIWRRWIVTLIGLSFLTQAIQMAVTSA